MASPFKFLVVCSRGEEYPNFFHELQPPYLAKTADEVRTYLSNLRKCKDANYEAEVLDIRPDGTTKTNYKFRLLDPKHNPKNGSGIRV